MGEIHKCRLFILGAYLAVKGVCNHYRASSYTADCLILIPHKHIPLFCHGFTAFYRAEHRYIPGSQILPEAAPQGTCNYLLTHNQHPLP